MINNKALLCYASVGVILLGAYSSTGAYYMYNNQKPVYEKVLDENDILTNDDNQLCYYFEAGEHIVQISRNDGLYHKIEQIDGYEIKEVEINGWRDNNKVTYVNTKPVLVVLKEGKDGLELTNQFGSVVDQKVLKR